MKPKEQRIAIAKACGWTEISPRMTWGLPPNVEDDGTENCLKQIPDYLNDLNAMHEAVRTLKSREGITYSDWLHQIAGYHSYDVSEATASQRAEAFLKAIGKWEGWEQ